MPSPSAVVIDTLNSLLEAELNSVFRFLAQGSPYLSRASADIRRPLQMMVETNERHTQELAALIDYLGGVPVPILGVQPEEQYLAFLSLKFLLPKLVSAKQLCIRRYENALQVLAGGPPEAIALLEGHLAEQRAHLEILMHAAAEVAPAARKSLESPHA